MISWCSVPAGMQNFGSEFVSLRKTAKLVILGVMLFLSAYTFADSIDITIMQPIQTGQSGNTLTFDVSLTNLTSATVFLNGAGITTSSPFLSMNDNPFLSNAPLSLGADATTGPFLAFTVAIAPGTPVGDYGLNNFSILGGSGTTNFSVIGSTGFGVNVSPAPEPATLLLVASGALGFPTMKFLKRGRNPSRSEPKA